MWRYLLITLFFCSSAHAQTSLKGKRICIDPGHGGTASTDTYRMGKNGEREEWINLRVALLLRDMLRNSGALVFLTRESDTKTDLVSRAQLARDSAADIFISIHHNATADSTVNFPVIYYHGAASENRAGVILAKCVARAMVAHLHTPATPVSIVSDYTIFPEKGTSVLRTTYGIPGLLCEASFFTNEAEEQKLRTVTHNKKEAVAYFNALECFFEAGDHEIGPQKIPLQLPAFSVLQEADRMKPEALKWLDDYKNGKQLMQFSDTGSLQRAYDLFTRSARSFPDSWVARECHLFRAEILTRLGDHEEAREARLRAEEYFVTFQPR